MNMKNLTGQGAVSVVGLAQIAAAALTIITYISLQSMYFTPVIVIAILAGIILYIAAAVTDYSLLTIPSYACYFFAMYRFLVLEVDYRMDTIVDTGVGTLDTMFFVICACFLITAILAILSSTLNIGKQK